MFEISDGVQNVLFGNGVNFLVYEFYDTDGMLEIHFQNKVEKFLEIG